MPSNQLSDVEEEEIHFSNVITTFRNYAQYSLAANNRRRKDIYCLPSADQQVLEAIGYKKKLDQVDDAIRANAEFLALIVANPEIFGHEVDADAEGTDEGVKGANEGEAGCEPGKTRSLCRNCFSVSRVNHSPHEHGHSHDRHQKYRPTDFDMDKLRSTLKQFARDWSEQGREEREACYQPMKDALVKHFSDVPLEQRGSLRVLVPGSGLGRLAYDVASMGFACQGNEFSHYMLLSSFLILNRTDSINKYTLYPYVHSFSNVSSQQAMLQPISIPDVLPSNLPPGSDFSLVAGDFEEIYGVDTDPNEPQAGEWNAILTCFFIDTVSISMRVFYLGKYDTQPNRDLKAKNIVNYLRVIHRILAPGGVWVNLGESHSYYSNAHGDIGAGFQVRCCGIGRTTIQTIHRSNSISKK
ncbi:hypothetical protein C0989_010381 [Termitomyces sp. Mn162]|nr:hypothetical protein C0989_010381 [Termitomyces sp. Mn162]